MKRISFLNLRIEIILDNLYKHFNETAFVDFMEVTLIDTLVLGFQFDLPKQEIILDVLF